MEKRYSFTEQELLHLIKLSFDIGRGSPPESGGAITLDWPMRILRHAMHFADEAGNMKDFPPEFTDAIVKNPEDLFA